MAKAVKAAEKVAEPQLPTAPEKPVGNRRYRVKEMAFIGGFRFRAGSIIVLADGAKMNALEPLDLTDEPSSIPTKSPVQTFPGSTPFPSPLEPPATR